MKKSYTTWSKSWQESRWCLAGLLTLEIDQCRESCPTLVHRQVRAHELMVHLNPRTILRRQEELPDRNAWGCGTGWRSSLIGLTEREEITGTIRVAGRRCGVLAVASCKTTSQDRREKFSQDEGNDEEMERDSNLASRDYSRKYVDCCQTQGDAVEEWHSSSWLEFKGCTVH